MLQRTAHVTLAWVLAFCLGARAVAQTSLSPLLERHSVILLGELHDSHAHHQARLTWLKALPVDSRLVLGFEQLDVDRQPDIDRAQQQRLPARELAQAAGFRFDGWRWEFYEPLVQLAIDRQWPIVALNLPAAEAMKAGRAPAGENSFRASGLAAVPWPNFSEVELAMQRNEIDQGHCGLMPGAMIPAVVRAQQARDATMAAAIWTAQRTRSPWVVALLGNGHVRKDWGVPRYLAQLDPKLSVYALALLEGKRSADAEKIFDAAEYFAPQERPDPCVELIKRFSAPPTAR